MDRVYVGNLPPNIRIKDIDDFFRPFGNLEYIDVNHRANPVYALVQFDNPRNAFMAVKSRHGYNFEGYTLQLRLVESEVRKRRDPTPPPPPPSMFNNDYGMQNNRGGFGNNYDNFNNNRMGQNYSNSSASSSFQSSQWGSFDNYNNNNRSNMSQYSSNNRMNMGQQNMMDYSSNNRSNMSYSSSSGRSNMSQPNMMSYSNENQSNMMNYSNNNSNYLSNSNYSNKSNWGNNDFGRGSYGGGNAGGNNNFTYNASQDPYTNANFEDNYTRGLSGAGRKWFNRYIREGYSAEAARAKALERRTVPYMRDDPKPKLAAVNNPTNAALENIGTTLMSLLSNTAADNFNSGNQMMPSGSNWGGDYDMPGPSRGRGEPRNAVSKQQYLNSLNILKRLRGRGSRDAKDRLSKKYHTQIVNDYERYEKQSRNERDRDNAGSSSTDGKSYTQLLVAFKKKKQHLLVAARKMGKEVGSSQSGAFRTKMRMLMNEGDFPRIEAKALAVHPVSKLKTLMEMKADYEAALKRKQERFPPLKEAALKKSARYRSDINYLKKYEKSKLEKLHESVQLALRACLNRIHRHEKERNLPLTKTKLDLLPSKTKLRRLNGRRPGSSRRGTRRGGEKKATKAPGKTDVKKENPTDENKKDEGQQEEVCEGNKNAAEEQHDGGNNQDAVKAK